MENCLFYSHSPCGSVGWNQEVEQPVSEFIVTPLAGVWVEIEGCWRNCNPEWCHSPCGSVGWNVWRKGHQWHKYVTPLAGVWVEMRVLRRKHLWFSVTPLAGVWVEIMQVKCRPRPEAVTPLAGVWVEISGWEGGVKTWQKSLPLRECGLKS